MKIAFLSISNGVVERGSEVFVHEIASRLAYQYAVCVYQVDKSKEKTSYKLESRKNIFFSPHQGPQSNRIQILINEFLYNISVFIFTCSCLKSLWKEKFDWIVPVNGGSQVLLCRLLRIFQKNKILITGHAGIGLDDWINLVIGRPNVFVVLTSQAWKWAKNVRNKSVKLYTILHGVDTDMFSPDSKKIKIALNSPIVLCVSALVPYKRIHLLIKAVATIPHVSLLLIGDGPITEYLFREGYRLLGNRFRLLNKVPHAQLPSYYSSCQAFSLPSESKEAFGLVYLEALAANLPIIAPDDPTRREILQDVGFYCNPENTLDYADAIKKALLSKKTNKYRIHALKFSWDTAAKQYAEIFSSC